ncbi:MAG TPA: hypothetical protein VIS48_12925 [Candidatus Kryptonia bacterium]
MGKKRHTVESIVAMLREIEVHSATCLQLQKSFILVRLPMLDRITNFMLVHKLWSGHSSEIPYLKIPSAYDRLRPATVTSNATSNVGSGFRF